ncbi:MAG: hypothetical protein A2Z25_11670 [Planctomycetes bacterium RBG_16_55_9]|nr:MAG: hypothetical protein A2Z25_11670 [Planctomycetes bacterium RBG_16_55_9]
MRKAILFTALAGIVLIVWTRAKREPVEEGRCNLKFKSVSKQDNMLVALATQYLASTTDKPSELKDLPKGLTADYVYFLAQLAGRNTPAVLASYSRLERSALYVDMDSDGLLSDEKPYRVKVTELPRPRGKEYKFGPILMKSRDEEGEFEIAFRATTYNGQQLILNPSGYRLGKVRLDKSTYKVAIMDGNLDGRYDKTFSPPLGESYRPGCDIFAVDLTKDGAWQFSSYWASEVTPLARMLKLYNTYYGIDVAPDGTTFDFKKIQPELGTLDFGGSNVKLKLWSDAAEEFLSGSDGKWQIPVGGYSALFIELNEIDPERNAWTFRSYRDTGSLHDFEIRTGQTTSFKIGSPFSIKTDVKQVADRVLIGLKLEGCAEEQYILPVMKGGKRLPTPAFKIVNESGEVLTSGQFKYG